MLEDLIGGMKPGSSAVEFQDVGEACPACGLTAAQFRTRGRLGCPRCYEMFRQSLLPLLERVHDGTTHRGRCPGKPTDQRAGEDEQLNDLRCSLRDAINAENYELAAQLRDQIQQLSSGEETSN
jgi:protein arginine kinase activator